MSDEAKIDIMSIIWYLIATSGSEPPSIGVEGFYQGIAHEWRACFVGSGSVGKAKEIVGAFATESTVVGVHSYDIGRQHIAEYHSADGDEVASFEQVVLSHDEPHEIGVDDGY